MYCTICMFLDLIVSNFAFWIQSRMIRCQITVPFYRIPIAAVLADDTRYCFQKCRYSWHQSHVENFRGQILDWTPESWNGSPAVNREEEKIHDALRSVPYKAIPWVHLQVCPGHALLAMTNGFGTPVILKHDGGALDQSS